MHYTVVHEDGSLQLARLHRSEDQSGARSTPPQAVVSGGSGPGRARVAKPCRGRERGRGGTTAASTGRIEIVGRICGRQPSPVGGCAAGGAAASARES